jgi:hypothetical protein
MHRAYRFVFQTIYVVNTLLNLIRKYLLLTGFSFREGRDRGSLGEARVGEGP